MRKVIFVLLQPTIIYYYMCIQRGVITIKQDHSCLYTCDKIHRLYSDLQRELYTYIYWCCLFLSRSYITFSQVQQPFIFLCFFFAFVYAPLIGWSMLYRYFGVQIDASYIFNIFFVLSTRRDWNVGKIIKHIHILFPSRGQVDRIYLRDIYLI